MLTALISMVLLSVTACLQGVEDMDNVNFNKGNPGAVPAIDAAAPAEYETATFAEGCFWGVESRFGAINGVIRTRVGYAGGTTYQPTYHNIGDHTESVQVDYDPRVVSYRDLLAVFWEGADPAMPPGLRQYMSLVIYQNEEQRQLAMADSQRLEKDLGIEVRVEITPLTAFYIAEDYHQKWNLQNKHEIVAELRRIYPRAADFINSTAATRINGYLGGNGNANDFNRDIDAFGLSAAATGRLRSLVTPLLGKPGSGDVCSVPVAGQAEGN